MITDRSLQRKTNFGTFPNIPWEMKNTSFLKYIAKKTKQLREAKGISQNDFFNDTGIHLGRVESADRDISVSTLKAICDYFGISVSDFFRELK